MVKIEPTQTQEYLRIPQQTSAFNEKQAISIFDVHENGIIDEGDFSISDKKDNFVLEFLKQNSGKEWTQKLCDEIKNTLYSLNKNNLEVSKNKYKIKIQDSKIIINNSKKEYVINIAKDQTVTKDDIQNLFNVISSFNDKVLEDFVKEINGINLLDDVFLGGLGFFNRDDTMDLCINKNNYALNKNTIIHELGHGISLIHKNDFKRTNFYSYNKELYEKFGGNDGVENLFSKLQNKYGKFNKENDKTFGDGYCLRNFNELFAEYYLYKNEGTTHHGSEKLFHEFEKTNDNDIKMLLKIMNKYMKFSKKDDKIRK